LRRTNGTPSPRVKRTNRVAIAHEDELTCGFGVENCRADRRRSFEYLDAPVRRVGALDTAVACNPDLEDALLPQTADLLKAIYESVK
jgi:2-oxoisovalerate dehydrogenase E1 component